MRTTHQLRLARSRLELGHKTLLMGIVNVTPDSFYPASRSPSVAEAVAQGLELILAGADLLDVGGESTRPGALPVPADIEAARVVPVIAALAGESPIPISVDTTKSEVARPALEAGAQMVNDISGLKFDRLLAATVQEYRAGLVISHLRGLPEHMHRLPPSPDIVGEVLGDLAGAVELAIGAGVGRDQLIVDPGIGFGKSAAECLRLLNRLEVLGTLGLPILVGVSRKAFIGRISGQEAPGDRLSGTAAAVACSILKGAHIVRVHDVAAMRQVAAVADAIDCGDLAAG
jgi:dihydropteroate synthase